ncbi:MAG: family 16 glycosylhydrolase [Opitutaceae bacterium]|nr:family 16 glycosylhydrolase [Cytophagales bacterium]
MKNMLIIFAIVLKVNLSFSQEWVPVWNEEFDYSGLPDETKWSYETGCANRNNESQYYASKRLENTKVENGFLTITTRKETLNGCNYTSGNIHTRYKANWLYGKIDVRAKLPKGKGMWPAIWMMSTDESYGTWPKSGEIDIMESVGFDPNKIFMTIHTEAYNHVIGTEKGSNKLLTDVYDTYHIYSIEWFPDRVDFLIDGTKYYTFPKSGNTTAVWPFDKPFYLILNVAVGGDWGGAQGIDPLIFPQQMSVDYVRVSKWQTNPGPYTVTTSSTSGGTFSLNPDLNTYPKGSIISLKATPQPGFVFSGWEGDISGNINPINFTVYDNAIIKAIFKTECELLQNGDFASSMSKWNMYTGDGAIAQTTVNNGQCNIVISNGGTNIWSTQLSQSNIPLLTGKSYKLSFDAYSEQSRTIKAGVGKNSDPFNTYSYNTVNLITTKKNFALQFDMNNTSDQLSKILFNLGSNASDVYLSNISLCDLSKITYINNEVEIFNEGMSISYENEKVHLTLPDLDRYEVNIYDFNGNTKFSNSLTGLKSTLDIKNFKSGLYVVKANNLRGKVLTQKLIIN